MRCIPVLLACLMLACGSSTSYAQTPEPTPTPTPACVPGTITVLHVALGVAVPADDPSGMPEVLLPLANPPANPEAVSVVVTLAGFSPGPGIPLVYGVPAREVGGSIVDMGGWSLTLNNTVPGPQLVNAFVLEVCAP